MKNILNSLNPKQQKAVQNTEGPLLILAGAGSGKTRTVVHRIAYLIANENVSPSNILAVTFTNKAAKEMKTRVRDMLASLNIRTGYNHEPVMGTFHSICVQILRQEIEHLGYKKSFVIFDTEDVIGLLRKIMKEQGIDVKKVNPRTVLHFISNAKNELKKADDFEVNAKSIAEEVAYQLFAEYQKRLKKNNALDFDDLINKTIELFRLRDDKDGYPIREKYQKRFQYILVDEYQDTNHAQYTLIKILAEKHRNLCVVGDDWQGIYSWRGANIQNILNFEKDYPEAKIILLEQNYRSTKNIVDASNFVIKENSEQKNKKLWTDNDKGEKIQVKEVYDEKDEADYVVDSILGKTKKKASQPFADDTSYEYEEETPSPFGGGILDTILAQRKGAMPQTSSRWEEPVIEVDLDDIDLNQYVVLYRTNAQSRVLEEVLLRRNIPYKIVGGIRFYERKEVKDTLAYLRVLLNDTDSVSMGRIINEPPRGIGATSWTKFEKWAEENSENIMSAIKQIQGTKGVIMPRAQNALQMFYNIILEVRAKSETLSVVDMIDLIMKKTEYKDYLLDGSEEGEVRWENIQELKSVASKFDKEVGLEALGKFLEEVALVSDTDSIDEESGVLTLMTVHSAKGLEFPNVFIVGMEEGLFPHSQSIFNPETMEEERRLCYVGMTRAKQRLCITYTSQRQLFGKTQGSMPSRFLESIPDQYIEKEEL